MQKSATIPHVSCHFIGVHLFLSISVFPSFPYGVQARQRVHILMGRVTRTFNDSLTGGLTVLSLLSHQRALAHLCPLHRHHLFTYLYPTGLGDLEEQRPHLISLQIPRTFGCLAWGECLTYIFVKWRSEWVSQSVNQSSSQWIHLFQKYNETWAIHNLWEKWLSILCGDVWALLGFLSVFLLNSWFSVMILARSEQVALATAIQLYTLQCSVAGGIEEMYSCLQ